MSSYPSPRSDVNSFSLARSESLDSLDVEVTSVVNTTHDVVVIGAGVAGLAAARDLQAKGLTVVLLEARDRVGGRICSQRITIDDKTFAADLGAMWIHGHVANPMAAIADSASIARVPTNDHSVAVYKGPGQTVTLIDRLAYMGTLWLFRLEMFLSRIFDRTDVGVQAVVDRMVKRWRLRGIGLRLLQLHLATMEKFDNTDLAQLSAKYWDAAAGHSFSGQEQMFPMGFGQVPAVLAKGLDVQLKTNNLLGNTIDHRVQHVSYNQSSVTVTTTSGKEYVGRYAVCTLPNGVLRAGHVAFDPPLPECKTQALQRIGVGCYHKTFLVYKTAFWDVDKHFLARVPSPEEPRCWLLFVNLHALFGVPVLLCINHGDYGRQLERLSDSKVAAIATEHLRRMFGNAVPKAPVQVVTTKWATDPLSCGAYSFAQVGCHPTDYEVLQAPLEGRLYFAGEGYSRYRYGFTHGALLSGQEAALSIAAHARV